jgi:hypothetical protein
MARIRIKQLRAFGPEFWKLKPGTEHETVTPPKGVNIYSPGCWVMGRTTPVRLKEDEYEVVSYEIQAKVKDEVEVK